MNWLINQRVPTASTHFRNTNTSQKRCLDGGADIQYYADDKPCSPSARSARHLPFCRRRNSHNKDIFSLRSGQWPLSRSSFHIGKQKRCNGGVTYWLCKAMQQFERLSSLHLQEKYWTLHFVYDNPHQSIIGCRLLSDAGRFSCIIQRFAICASRLRTNTLRCWQVLQCSSKERTSVFLNAG